MDRLIAFVLLFFFLFAGCATMFSQREDTVTIKTEPPGAEVYLGVEPLGTTPLTRTFKRSTFEQKNLNIRKEGYKTKELPLMRTVEPVALFNFGFFTTTGGATSWGIDAMTGAMTKYDPNSYYIDLEPEEKRSNLLEDHRRSRAAFVISNHHRFKEEIARGGGAYLSAYYQIRRRPERYDAFLQRLRDAAPALLSQEDGVDFYHALEARLH
ncbi:MAG: PEGA domain-containing protein [Nitrospirae bacterium]|nr:PEGA domain-containing protein [Candidatus Manganitrophaceae bacterium]